MKLEIVLLILIFNYAEGFFGIYSAISCYMGECCEPYSKWMPLDLKRLEEDLNSKLHGQHIVKKALKNHMRSHIEKENPSNALLISFNGMTGTGKNYVSEIIAESLFEKGMESKYVHKFISNIDFPKKSKIEEYKDKLRKIINDSVRECDRSLFIFDEVHDMPETLFDVITPFADNHKSIDGVDYRKSIYVFLSNSGDKYINSKYVEMYKGGRGRESITLEDFENELFSFKDDAFSKSKLVKQYLITAFIAFLPLERRHIELCIQNHLKKMNEHFKSRKTEIIMKKIKFIDFNGLELAKQGCKRIDKLLERIEDD